MPPANPPPRLSSLPSFVRSEQGDTLTPEQYRRLFAGGEHAVKVFIQHLASHEQAHTWFDGDVDGALREIAFHEEMSNVRCLY